MRNLLHNRLTALCFLIIFTASAILSVSAHRLPQYQINDELTAFLQAGGELADICGSNSEAVTTNCETCNLVDAATVPEREMLLGSADVLYQQTFRDASQSLWMSTSPNLSYAIRAPPQR